MTLQELRQVDGEVGMRREALPARQVQFEDLVEGPAADPHLDAEPPAGDEGAEQRGDIGAAHAEGRAAVHGKRDAVLGPGVAVQDHRHQDDDVGEDNGQHRLPPVHALVDQ